MPLNINSTRERLQAFEFGPLFIDELGWEPPASRKVENGKVKDLAYSRKPVARLSGIGVFEIAADGGVIPDANNRAAIHKQISELCFENLLIFTDAARTQSLWYWVKRESGKAHARDHLYVKGQPGDLFLSKLAAIFVDISELDEKGNISTVEVAGRLKAALDIEKVTKRFFTQFAEEHGSFLDQIQGIPDNHDRRWYASVILNRLMFIWFLQKKFFLADGNANYLPDLLVASQKAGKNRFFSHTLRDLFFEGFAKLASRRACIGSVPLGDIPYLNGGLFLPHGIEARIEGDPLFAGPFARIRIPDSAFADVFRLFSDYSWSLSDTPGGDDREINPDVLGYIFEKYINQKEFGAYYTRPEITEYLCEQTINQLVLDAANKHAEGAALLHKHGLKKGPAPRRFDTMSNLLLHADGTTCRLLLQEDLPRLSLLDPACGSGAFLVAAMRTLLGLITALIGRCEAIGEKAVLQWVEAERKKHKAPLAYWVKKKIITENLYGVDIMEEAVEIAKLRLFLALVASADKRDQLEPLPNIEFNLMPGNSLIGLLHVDPARYDQRTGAGRNGGGEERIGMLHEPGPGELGMRVESKTAPTETERVVAYLAKKRTARYEELLREKNRLVTLYKSFDSWGGTGEKRGELKALTGLRDQIEAANRAAREILNKLLLDEFQGLGIQFEQATWDAKKQKEGKPVKRLLAIADVEALRPFHWAYEFDEIVVNRGGFDAIITNPPWESVEPGAKKFFAEHSDLVSKNKMTLKDFEKEQARVLKQAGVMDAWLAYHSRFNHVRAYFRSSPQFVNQVPIIDGKRQGKDVNLYKLFLEQSVHLLRANARCGIVIPSGVYTDLGGMRLREMLFEKTRITGLFCFENRKQIFENVDSRFKFVVLSFEKGGMTVEFPATYMRHDVTELARFPESAAIRVSVDSARKLSPDSLSLMEFRSEAEVNIAEKLFHFPLLSEVIEGRWSFKIHREFNLTDDIALFHQEPGKGRLPLLTGKMFHHFERTDQSSGYWLDEKDGRKALSGRAVSSTAVMDYQRYRWVYRRIASNMNQRTLISTIAPKMVFTEVNSPTLDLEASHASTQEQLFLCAVANSFALDWYLRLKVTTTLNFFYIYQLPIPRLTAADPAFRPLVERAARLVGTSAEFDDLMKEVFSPKANHKTHSVTDPFARQTLRAEVDALVARLYDLTEAEFAHILGTFPLVDESVKQQTLNTYRDLLRLGKLPDNRL